MIDLESEIVPRGTYGVLEGPRNGVIRDAIRAHAMVKAIEYCKTCRCALGPDEQAIAKIAHCVEERIEATLKRWGYD